jgi:hypothetical protein
MTHVITPRLAAKISQNLEEVEAAEETLGVIGVKYYDERPPERDWTVRFPGVDSRVRIARESIRRAFPAPKVKIDYTPQVLDRFTGECLRGTGVVVRSTITNNIIQFVEVYGGFKVWLEPARPRMIYEIFGSVDLSDSIKVIQDHFAVKADRQNLTNREKFDPWFKAEMPMCDGLTSYDEEDAQTDMCLFFSQRYHQGFLCTRFISSDDFLLFMEFAMRYLDV